jgi:nucleotide-binding universal stress UspA family protein
LDAAQLAGFGFGQAATTGEAAAGQAEAPSVTWEPEPIEQSKWREIYVDIKRVAILLDGSVYAAQALPVAKRICRDTGARLSLLSGVKAYSHGPREQFNADLAARERYLDSIIEQIQGEGFLVEKAVLRGAIADVTQSYVAANGIDLVVTTTRGKSGQKHWMSGGVSAKLMTKLNIPVFLVQGEQPADIPPPPSKILVALDGSIASEQVLPYARYLGKVFDAELTLISVPVVPETEKYRAPADVLQSLRQEAETKMQDFLDAVARSLRKDDVQVSTLVTGTRTATTIVDTAEKKGFDLICLTSNGRGTFERIMLGSDAERIVQNTDRSVLMMPVRNDR